MRFNSANYKGVERESRVEGRIQAVSRSNQSIKVNGEWFKFSGKTQSSVGFGDLKVDQNVEVLYLTHRWAYSGKLNYVQFITLVPEPHAITQIANGDLEYELRLVQRKQNDVESRINWFLDSKTSDELLRNAEYKSLEKEAWELFHREQEITEKLRRVEVGGLEQRAERASGFPNIMLHRRLSSTERVS